MDTLTVCSNYPYPSRSITQLAWKPSKSNTNVKDTERELAIASEDSSLRIYSIKLGVDT